MRHHKRTIDSNCDHTNDFLKVAISDLTGNLMLLDTKISIIMATAGVIMGLVIACKSNILRAYYFYSNHCFLKFIFLLLSTVYIISIIVTFAFGIKCIMIRFGKSESPSLWFFKTEDYGGISEQCYMQKVKHMTNEKIMKNLAIEVYKLNKINNRKMRAGRLTVVLFSISCVIIVALLLMVGIFYLVV